MTDLIDFLREDSGARFIALVILAFIVFSLLVVRDRRY